MLLKPVWLGLRALHQAGRGYLTAHLGPVDHRLLCTHVTFTVRLREPGSLAEVHTVPQCKEIKYDRDET